MTALELLSTVRQSGISLRADGDRLRYDAPTGAMTPELRDVMYDIYVPPAHDGFVVHDTPTRERGASFAASLNLCFYPAPTPPARDGSARP